MNDGGLHRTQGGLRHGASPYKKSHEELGTKDDERKPERLKTGGRLWRMIPKMRRRRVLLCALVLFLLWIFTYYRLPASQLVSQASLTPTRPASRYRWPLAAHPPPPAGPVDGEHYYHGDIIFYKLPKTLHGIPKTRPYNRNVLFAASSLKSAAVLIPLACDMAKSTKNYVHLAIMGCSDLSMEEILEINGVDEARCKIFWHDARPDYAAYSTEERAELSVSAALGQFATFMHPQAIITDDSVTEDGFFARALKQRTMDYNIPHIELPANNAERLAWVTQLESSGLAAWHRATIDILIQAQPDSTGSLMRLLTSLYAADFAGLALPRLIIELPHEVDSITQTYLSNFRWPPPSRSSDPRISDQLHVRRRIPSQRLSAEEASIRFLESFYPANPTDSHVLLLSSRSQLSPLFFHYLKYHLLQHYYSSFDSVAATLLGLSLEIPSTYLNGTTPFEPPTSDLMDATQLKFANLSSPDSTPPFLWQAPNSNAALYFGSKWVELHSFLSHRLQRFHSSPSSSTQRPKLVSTEHPAWTEYVLEFMRARGYTLLYPGRTSSSPSEDEALVTIHNEFYQPPEEFLAPRPGPTTPAADQDPNPPPKDPFTFPSIPPLQTPPSHPELPLAPLSRLLPAILPFQYQPPLSALPLLAANGTLLTPQPLSSDAEAYAEVFRVEIGGCGAARGGGRRGVVKAGSAEDLFCFGEEEGGG